jgi:hypothetical protein
MTKFQEQQLVAEIPQGQDARVSLIQDVQREIDRLKRFASRGLWALSLFLLLCILARQDFSHLTVPESLQAYMGKPPSASVISIMLLLYTFFAIMLSLSRMMAGVEHRSSFCHVGYLAAFFFFYHFAGGLDDNYWAVFGSGMTILGVESYRIWTYCSETVAT